MRVLSFNVENLFSRAKLLNFGENSEAAGLLAKVEQLRAELGRKTYDAKQIVALWSELKKFIDIVEVRGKLFNRARTALAAKGTADWSGFIEFKRDDFSETARMTTAQVLREVNADVCCLVEVESRPVLKNFCKDRLKSDKKFEAYAYHMLVDGNDERGIDVALASRYPFGAMRSHVEERYGKGQSVFSRDCLEIEIQLPSGAILHLLMNHFKSKGYGDQKASDAKRKRQADRVAELLRAYDLRNDFVIVAGDFNDTPDSPPVAALTRMKDLHDVLAETYPKPEDRWTYHYQKNQQIDYLLLSAALRKHLTGAGVERRGIFGVDKHTKGAVQPFPEMKTVRDAASDHGAVWADFAI